MRCTPPFFTVLVGLSLSACSTLQPEYHPPDVAASTQWRGAAESKPLDAAALAHWWRQFNDPVLDGLIADALAANLDLATARAKLREARARREGVQAGLGLAVEASGSASRSKSSAESGSGATRNAFNLGFDASWEPDVFGAARQGVAAAEADLEASAAALNDARVSLLAEVARNYVELRTGEQRLAIAESSLAAQTEIFELTHWRQLAGLVSELDEAQARTQLEQTRAGLPALRTVVAEARNRLAILLGRAPGELDARLSAGGPAKAMIPVAAQAVALGIPADTLRQRPDVRAAERRLAAQTARLSEAEAARYPSFRLSGSLGLDAPALGRLFSGHAGAASLLARISAPIFDAGRIQAAIGVQDALLEQSRLAYQAAVLTALEDVENALTALANSRQRQVELTSAAASARQTLDIAHNRYAAGLADFQTVLDAQRTQLNLQDQLASSTGDFAGAQIRLFKALGGGWSAKVEANNKEKRTTHECCKIARNTARNTE